MLQTTKLIGCFHRRFNTFSKSSIYNEMHKKFIESFPTKSERTKPRKIGREAEYPVVWKDGTAADIRVLLEEIVQRNPSDFRRKYETGFEPSLSYSETTQLSGLDGKNVSLSLEVGWGTIEVILDPEPTLTQLKGAHEAIMAKIVCAADHLGMNLLGYGVQPRTPKSLSLMSPRNRYFQLYSAICEPWLGFTVTASDQIHVDICREEVIDVNNICNLLCPLVIALCGNSPIVAGKYSGFCSSREAMMGEIQSLNRRHGMPLRPFKSVEDFLQTLASYQYLARPVLGNIWEVVDPKVTFEEYFSNSGLNWKDFNAHERYIWHSARPRMKQGTVELRSACQQPWNEHMAATTLQFAIVQASEEIGQYIDKTFAGDMNSAWIAMSRWHADVVQHGLGNLTKPNGIECDDSVSWKTFTQDILGICATSLEKRGFGEEQMLTPLYRRLDMNENPAQTCLRIAKDGGLPAVLDHLRIT